MLAVWGRLHSCVCSRILTSSFHDWLDFMEEMMKGATVYIISYITSSSHTVHSVWALSNPHSFSILSLLMNWHILSCSVMIITKWWAAFDVCHHSQVASVQYVYGLKKKSQANYFCSVQVHRGLWHLEVEDTGGWNDDGLRWQKNNCVISLKLPLPWRKMMEKVVE